MKSMDAYYNIIDYGAVGDGRTLNTAAIQKAIDDADKKKGTVVIPKGEFLTGSLNLKGASFYLAPHAVIKGSPNLEDYPEIGYYHNEMHEVTSLLYSMNHEDICIYGQGTIDFNGSSFYDLDKVAIPDYYKVPLTKEQTAECNHPMKETGRVNQPLFFENVEKLVLDGITLLDSSCWTISLSHCRNVTITNLTINTSRSLPNNDGIHISASRDVIIKGCHISTGDDCIALTCITDWEAVCENVTISDCVLTCCSKAIVLGYMYSIVRNVTVNNCVIQNSNRGFCIMSSAGSGVVENVTVNNLIIDTKICAGNWWGNGEPICLLGTEEDTGFLTYFLDVKPERNLPYAIDNVIINGVVCHGENAIGVVADRGNIHNITLANIYYNAKESKNLELKGRTIDTNPALDFVEIPMDCFLIVSGTESVKLINVNGDKRKGIDRVVYL
ncbi:MAG: glycoside hydrolase family 28 protein [Oliverpabstia sp.]